MVSTHIHSAYDEDLKFLTRRISEMGGLAEQMVGESVRALVNGDVSLAQKVISDDTILDHAEREVGDKAILTIARRQPMAADLREIMGSIRIAADLERVGDLGKNTAKRVLAVQGTGVPRSLGRGIEHLSELALVQLKEVLDVYTTRSPDKAVSIRERDEEIDAIVQRLPEDARDRRRPRTRHPGHARTGRTETVARKLLDDRRTERERRHEGARCRRGDRPADRHPVGRE